MKRIAQIFSETLDIPMDKIVDTLSYVDFDPWDSVTHMRIVAKIEREFDVEFEMNEIIAMDSFLKVKEIVAKRLKLGT